MGNGISVVIPAYKAERFIDECLLSILAQEYESFEILVGIDGCTSTLDHIIPKAYPEQVRFFYFEQNRGPYVVKNSLTTECKYNNLLFFDADDVMAKDTLLRFDKLIQEAHLVRLPYINFNFNFNPKRNKTWGNAKADGTFGVRKDMFESINGFYDWKCSADTEFVRRTEQLGWKHTTMEGVAIFRRIHGNNLTIHPDTNFTSDIRKTYDRIIREQPRHNPSILITHPYSHVKHTNA